jgi:glutamate formiminotransferase / 5-formyltetrahydrofolate cyclo-ligase
MNQIIECVPNISEGRDENTIAAIVRSVQKNDGVKLLHVDSGFSANRTVITFVGNHRIIGQAAFQMIKKATELIDMRNQKGEHPRLGAVDVFPFVPVKGISMEQTVKIARQTAQKVGVELKIPVYCYENAAFYPERKSLSFIRKGEYEGLAEKIKDQAWKPDFGPCEIHPKAGACIIGARPFLVAYNVNLDTTDISFAKKIAAMIRESSKSKNALTRVRAIGWYMDEYKMAQVSTNILDYKTTSISKVYETVKRLANDFGIETKGSEIIGMLPEEAIIFAKTFYPDLNDVNDKDIITKEIINKTGLNAISEFEPSARIINNLI